MTTYIALLRGINVSGKNIIKMVELKQLFKNKGFNNVTTYIQSGNILFNSNETPFYLLRETQEFDGSKSGFTRMSINALLNVSDISPSANMSLNKERKVILLDMRISVL